MPTRGAGYRGAFHFLHNSTIVSVADLTHPNLPVHNKLIFAKNETHPGYRPSAYLPGLPTENLPGPVLWTDEIRSLIDVLGRARWGDLGCIDSKDYLHITPGSQRDGVKGNVVVFGIGIAAGELVVGRT
jgi:hypothetical protein